MAGFDWFTPVLHEGSPEQWFLTWGARKLDALHALVDAYFFLSISWMKKIFSRTIKERVSINIIPTLGEEKYLENVAK